MNIFRNTLAITLIALFMALPAVADNHEKESVARMVLITPKAGHDEVLIKAITDYHHWVAQFEGHMQYDWYEILTGPNTGKYIAWSGGHQWADLDKTYDWEKKAGEVFMQNVAPNIEHMEISINSQMTTMSHWPEDWDGYSMFQVQDWFVHNGKGGEFRRGLKRIVETLKANEFPMHFGFHSVDSGGYGNQVTFVSPRKGWADMAEKSPTFFEIMSKELGGEEEFEAFMSSWSATFKTGHSRTVRYMPEASDYGK